PLAGGVGRRRARAAVRAQEARLTGEALWRGAIADVARRAARNRSRAEGRRFAPARTRARARGDRAGGLSRLRPRGDAAREPRHAPARLLLGQHALARGLADLALGLAHRVARHGAVGARKRRARVLDRGLEPAADLAVARAPHEVLTGALLRRLVLSQNDPLSRRRPIVVARPGAVERRSAGFREAAARPIRVV